MTDTKTLVTDEEIAGVDDSTASDGEVSEETRTTSTADVEAELEKSRQAVAKLQDDLNSMKSSFQKREARLTREFEEREKAYKDSLREQKLSEMTDEERTEYLSNEKVRELEDANRRLMEAQERREAEQKTINYFLSQGVSMEALNTDEGYDELIASGWKAINDERESMRVELESLRQAKEKVSSKKSAPTVLTDLSGDVPVDGPTWHDLEKKYGTMENVYSLIESGQLSPDVLPN